MLGIPEPRIAQRVRRLRQLDGFGQGLGRGVVEGRLAVGDHRLQPARDVLDGTLPVEIPIPPIAEIQQALFTAAIQVTGAYPDWELKFDDGEDPSGEGEPDFDDIGD